MVSITTYSRGSATDPRKDSDADDTEAGDTHQTEEDSQQFQQQAKAKEDSNGGEVDEWEVSLEAFCNERYKPAIFPRTFYRCSFAITVLAILWATFHIVMKEDQCATPKSLVATWKQFPGALTWKEEGNLLSARRQASIYGPLILIRIYGPPVEHSHGSFKMALLVLYCLLGGSLLQALVASPCSFVAYWQYSGAWAPAFVVQARIFA